jgi:hypothetical protein
LYDVWWKREKRLRNSRSNIREDNPIGRSGSLERRGRMTRNKGLDVVSVVVLLFRDDKKGGLVGISFGLWRRY